MSRQLLPSDQDMFEQLVTALSSESFLHAALRQTRVIVQTVECPYAPEYRFQELPKLGGEAGEQLTGEWPFEHAQAYRFAGEDGDVLMVALPTHESGYARLVYTDEGLGSRRGRELRRKLLEESGVYHRPELGYLDLLYALRYADAVCYRHAPRRPHKLEPESLMSLYQEPRLLDDPRAFSLRAWQIEQALMGDDELRFRVGEIKGALHRDGRLHVPHDSDTGSGYLEQVLEGLVERALLAWMEREEYAGVNPDDL